MKTKLLLLAALAFTSVNSFAQTTLFSDNFDPATFPVGATANVSFSSNPGTLSDLASGYAYKGLTSASAGWVTTNANGSSGRNCVYNAEPPESFTTNLCVYGSSTATFKGSSTTSVALSSFASGFNTKLSENTGIITWSYSMRINRSTQ